MPSSFRSKRAEGRTIVGGGGRFCKGAEARDERSGRTSARAAPGCGGKTQRHSSGGRLSTGTQGGRRRSSPRTSRPAARDSVGRPPRRLCRAGKCRWATMEGSLCRIGRDRRETARQSFDLGDLQLTCLGLDESYRTGLNLDNPRPDRFHLVLGHSPNFALGHVAADLLVAGHTHAGQVRVPGVGPLIIHARVSLSWAAGLTELPGGGRLLVSRGIGMDAATPRRCGFSAGRNW